LIPASAPDAKPLIFVTVGMDHHPFDRLVRWVDAWLEAGGSERARCLVQSGTATPPRRAEWRDYLSHEELEAVMQQAAVVVCHGGPGTIASCRRLGLVPVVVPRRRALREAVDGHQVTFARRTAALGHLLLSETEERLMELLDRVLVEPGAFRSSQAPAETDRAVRRFEEAVERLARSSGRKSGEDPGSAVRVLYIGGSGRSGSTLLERVLGQLPRFCAVGELVHVWRRGVRDNQLCGCGTPFRECPFWDQVGKEAFGGWENLDLDEVLSLQETVDRHRFIPFMLAPSLWPGYERRARRYSAYLTRLYQAIHNVADARVIVDSSKSAPFAFLLGRAPGLDLRVVHLVRDSHGVAFSWTRRVPRPEVRGGGAYMPTYHPARAGFEWITDNLLFHVLGTTGVPHALLRYETLVRDPRRQIQRVLELQGERADISDLEFIRDGYVEVEGGHSVSGNPMRFDRGQVPLRVDDEWRRKMDRNDRVLVSAITWPLLLRYGYLGDGQR
jgi:UDP-N-acetylglucosamine transferase subunit ALG13